MLPLPMTFCSAIAGGLAGLISVYITNPVDVVKTNM